MIFNIITKYYIRKRRLQKEKTGKILIKKEYSGQV